MRESFKKIIGFDTETIEENGVQKFYSFQAFSPELKLNYFTTDREMLRNLFTFSTMGSYFVCANAEFDISVMQQILKDSNLKIEMIYTPSKLIKATVKDENNHRWHIIDIFNVFPRYSVHKLGELLNVPKLDRPEYLGKRKPTDFEMEYFKQYAMKDAEIAYLACRMIISEFGKVKATLPSLTMSLYRKQMPKMLFWRQPESLIHEKIHNAYRGGRVESFKRGSLYENVYAYDVRSLYPSVMTNSSFPDINDMPNIKNDINFDKEGCAHVTISQDANIPPLSIRHEIKDVGSRLVFPNGRIKQWFTYPELRYIETHGYGKIIKVHEAIEWKKSFKPFKGWVKFLFDTRAKYLEEKNEKAELYKLMMNSLYGKFAQNLDVSKFIFEDQQLIEVEKKPTLSKNTHYIIASYITANGRLRLHRLMMQNKGDDILYCDTDGFLTTKNNFDTNDILGGLTKRFDNKPIQLTTLLRAKMYIIDGTVKMRGLTTKINGFDMRMRIMKGQMTFTKNILLKPRQATSMHKEPLSVYVKSTRFNLKSDGKRIYNKTLDSFNLITEFTDSKPLELMID